MLVFDERRKPEYPGKNLSWQSRGPTNSIHIWHLVRKSNPGHIGGRQVYSPLGQPCHHIVHVPLIFTIVRIFFFVLHDSLNFRLWIQVSSGNGHFCVFPVIYTSCHLTCLTGWIKDVQLLWWRVKHSKCQLLNLFMLVILPLSINLIANFHIWLPLDIAPHFL